MSEEVMAYQNGKLTTVDATPQMFIEQAIQKGLSIEHLEKLMSLQERWQANQAKISFFDAMSKFQSIVPALEKTKQVAFNEVKYKYAPLGEIAATIKNAMFECGLSHRWTINDTETSIVCTCIVSHKEGHSESTTLSGLKDSSGKKNDIQQRGSTVSYLQRYSLIAALGLSTADEDNDGQSSHHPAQQVKPTYQQKQTAPAQQTTPQAQQPKAEVKENAISWDVWDCKTEVVLFGKHKGVKWSELDLGYLRWVKENGKADMVQKAELTLKYLESMQKQQDAINDFPMLDVKPAATLEHPLIDTLIYALDDVAKLNDVKEMKKWYEENTAKIDSLTPEENKFFKSQYKKSFDKIKGIK